MDLGLRQRRLRRGTPRPFRAARFRPCLEVLEDRRLLATLEVTSLLDGGGAGTLRSQLAAAKPGDDIVINGLTGAIQLTRSLDINTTVRIVGGEMPSDITISGGGASRVFVINAPNVQIARLTIADGLAGQGGGIFNLGLDTSINNCIFIGNRATTGGGAIFNAGANLLVTGCRFIGNQAPTGAAVFSPGSGALSQSVVSGNTAANAIANGPAFAINDVFLATGAEITATVGTPFTRVVATFTSLSGQPVDPRQVSAWIDWGDQGEPSLITEFDGTSGVFQVLGTHTYLSDTTFPIRVSINTPALFFDVQASAAVLTPGQAAQLTGSDTDTALPGDEVLIASSSGVKALLALGDTEADPPATLFVGTFAGNPERVPSDGIVFYDVRVTDVPAGSVLFVTFRYPNGIGTLVNLKFFDPATRTYRLVQSPLILNDTVNHTLTVLINGQTLPSLAMMGHTVFTIAIAAPPQEVQQLVSPAVASANTVRTGLPAGIPTTFSSSTPVTLTLTPIQQSQLTVGQAAVGPAITATVTSDYVGSADLRYQWVWELFHLEDMLQWIRQTPGKTEEAMPPEEPEEMPQELLLDMPLPMDGDFVPAAMGLDSGVEGEVPDLAPVPVADAVTDSFRLACIGLAFAGAVGMCAERSVKRQSRQLDRD